MSHLADAVRQIRTARGYTNDLLDHVPEELWFRMSPEGVSHVAWQAGHLAVCEYGLAMKRLRGVKPEDDLLVRPEHFEMFGKGSIPEADPSKYLSVPEIRDLMKRVHKQTLSELALIDDAIAAQPTDDPPHPMFKTKLGALLWCAQHEFLHAGQIGLIRRQFGENWLR